MTIDYFWQMTDESIVGYLTASVTAEGVLGLALVAIHRSTWSRPLQYLDTGGCSSKLHQPDYSHGLRVGALLSEAG